MEHEQFHQEVQLTSRSRSGKKGNNTFGAVLVHEGKIIATAEKHGSHGARVWSCGIQSIDHKCPAVCRTGFAGMHLLHQRHPLSSLCVLNSGHRCKTDHHQRYVMTCSPAYFQASLRCCPSMISSGMLGLKDVTILEPFLEEEGLRAFEYWGGNIVVLRISGGRPSANGKEKGSNTVIPERNALKGAAQPVAHFDR